MTKNNLLYALALQNVPKIGDITAKKLIQHCGSAEEVLKEKKNLGDLLEVQDLKRFLLKSMLQVI